MLAGASRVGEMIDKMIDKTNFIVNLHEMAMADRTELPVLLRLKHFKELRTNKNKIHNQIYKMVKL